MKVTIGTPPVKKVVQIDMSEEEARSLLTVCEHIGGDPKLSRRKHFDSLKRALKEAGIALPRDRDSGASRLKSLYFDDVEESCL